MDPAFDIGDPRGRRHARAKELASQLALRHVSAIALTWVDNAGITRVKTVPTRKLLDATDWGVGMSPIFDVYAVDDSITTSTYIGGPVGDLRLYPDLDQVTALDAQPGWAWGPVDRRTQNGEVYPACQRSFARRMAAAAVERGVSFQMAFEVEWFVGHETEEDGVTPACSGPAYGMTRVIELTDYIHDLLESLAAQGVPVEQFHPEYAPGQLELSVAPTDPVGAADRHVLVRQTIRAVSEHYGFRASFAPVVTPGITGNGPHLHLSAWSAGQNLFTGGPGVYGLTEPGESLLAEVLDRLPALCAITAPSAGSYLRLVPQQWAAPYQCWGRENREAALRLVTGTAGSEHVAANVELKCVDGSANPYLVVGSVLAVAVAGLDRGRTLPPEVTVDPSTLPEAERPPRLPRSIPEAVERLSADEVIGAAMGEPLLHAFLAVRRAEAEIFAHSTEAEIAAATRWAY
ncbi:glutamine synthetase family protein [Actinopolymorpha alba]|uniref:glutamine synthetase family protein n=1 Tax=Actinopolymorpha alba TaxID=533267 RepID=UPI00037F7B41|nr:glutamine synthetase family protein [Actinopolymorpha alba]